VLTLPASVSFSVSLRLYGHPRSRTLCNQLMKPPPEILETPQRSTLSSTYQISGQVYDEMLAAPGVLRPHWETLIQALNAMGGEELLRRWEHARRTIRENGVTYNVYGDPRGMNRPWELDTIPLLIPAEE